MSVVVSDSGPVHYLVLCGAIEILPKLFHRVVIPPAVNAELRHSNTPPSVIAWINGRHPWLEIIQPKAIDYTIPVDPGEREAISLALEIKADAILLDDRKGRIEATRLGLKVAGTIGLLQTAATEQLIDFLAAINTLRSTNARLDKRLIESALAQWRSNHP